MADHLIEKRGPSGQMELAYRHTESGGTGYVEEYTTWRLGVIGDQIVLAVESTVSRVRSDPQTEIQQFALTVEKLVELFKQRGTKP
jgi:hypothetical protein